MAKVKALKWHTHQGQAHDIGEVYEVDAGDVDNLQAQQMAAPVEDAAPATPVPTGETAVSPMTTEDLT